MKESQRLIKEMETVENFTVDLIEGSQKNEEVVFDASHDNNRTRYRRARKQEFLRQKRGEEVKFMLV